MSLPETSEADAVVEVKQRRSGSSRQPQHFFSSTATGDGWGLEKGRKTSLGLGATHLILSTTVPG